jgi:hypothetical protein
MANSKTEPLHVECPCCKASLTVDSHTGLVLTHKAAEKPKQIEDIVAAAQSLKGEAARREEAFQKSFHEQKARQGLLDKQFDELLKRAKSDPNTGPFKPDIDLD